MTNKIEEAKLARLQERVEKANKVNEAQADNVKYIDYLLDLDEEVEAIDKLSGLINQINNIETIVTNEGNKYSVNCFALPEYIFGPVMARLLGIVNVAGAMFTDERQKEFSAILGVPYLAVSKAALALGRPAYYKQGNVEPALDYNLDQLNMALTHLSTEISITLPAVKASQLDRWFTNAKLKAVTKQEELSKSKLLDETSSFTIEDNE